MNFDLENRFAVINNSKANSFGWLVWRPYWTRIQEGVAEVEILNAHWTPNLKKRQKVSKNRSTTSRLHKCDNGKKFLFGDFFRSVCRAQWTLGNDPWGPSRRTRGCCKGWPQPLLKNRVQFFRIWTNENKLLPGAPWPALVSPTPTLWFLPRYNNDHRKKEEDEILLSFANLTPLFSASASPRQGRNHLPGTKKPTKTSPRCS